MTQNSTHFLTLNHFFSSSFSSSFFGQTMIALQNKQFSLHYRRTSLHLETLSHFIITHQDTYHLRHTFPCIKDSYDLKLKRIDCHKPFFSSQEFLLFLFHFIFFLIPPMFSITVISNSKIY